MNNDIDKAIQQIENNTLKLKETISSAKKFLDDYEQRQKRWDYIFMVLVCCGLAMYSTFIVCSMVAKMFSGQG